MRRKPGQLVPLERSILEASVALRGMGMVEAHGFLLARTIADQTGATNLTAYGSLYKALDRLERATLLTSRWEDPREAAEAARPRRRFYRLTAAGDAALAEIRAADPAVVRDPRPDRSPVSQMLVRRRRTIARDHGATLVRGWVAFYTLGLPGALRGPRRAEIEADLAEETMDAVRQATVAGLAGRRMVRLLMGIRADLAWRLLDAPAMAAALRDQRCWVPPTRWTLIALAVAAVGTAGALALVAGPLLDPSARSDPWLGWGPYGFAGGCVAALVAIAVAVPAPHRAVAIVVPAAILGTLAAPWFVGPWLLVVIAVSVRWYESRSTRSEDR